MGLDRKDMEMMAVSIPTVDYFDIREDIERLTDTVNRLEKVLEAFITLFHEERVRDFERILNQALDRQEAKKTKTFIKPIFKLAEEVKGASLEVED